MAYTLRTATCGAPYASQSRQPARQPRGAEASAQADAQHRYCRADPGRWRLLVDARRAGPATTTRCAARRARGGGADDPPGAHAPGDGDPRGAGYPRATRTRTRRGAARTRPCTHTRGIGSTPARGIGRDRPGHSQRAQHRGLGAVPAGPRGQQHGSSGPRAGAATHAQHRPAQGRFRQPPSGAALFPRSGRLSAL